MNRRFGHEVRHQTGRHEMVCYNIQLTILIWKDLIALSKVNTMNVTFGKKFIQQKYDFEFEYDTKSNAGYYNNKVLF